MDPLFEEGYAKHSLGFFAEFCNRFENLDELRVLDIGCGTEDWKADWFLPWPARLLGTVCKEVIGIDLYPSDEKTYTHLVADMTKKDLSEVIGDKKFDVVITGNFFSSPSLFDIIGHNKGWVKRMIDDIYNVLEPEGSFFTEPFWIGSHLDWYRDSEEDFKIGKEYLEEKGFVLDEERYLNHTNLLIKKAPE